MVAWSDSETLKLIELWSDDDLQSQLEGCKRNRAVFESISRRMNEAGFERSGNQCHEKIKLSAEYKKVKDNNNQMGNNRKTCKKLDNVLTSKPATRPPVLVDLIESSCVNGSSDSQDDHDSSGESASSN